LIEVGTGLGEAAALFLEFDPRVNIVCVDPHHNEQHHTIWCKRFEGNTRVSLIRNPSLEAVLHIPDKSVDAVYIDGLHDEPNVYADAIAWEQKVCDGGAIGGHDWCERFPGVARAVRRVYPVRYVQLFEDDSWLVRL